MVFDRLRPNIMDWTPFTWTQAFKINSSPFKIYEFFYTGLKPVTLPLTLDLGPFKIQVSFLIKSEANFQYFFGSENIYYIHKKKTYFSKIWKIQKTQFS